MVPKPANEVEETANDEAENGAATGSVSAALFRARRAAVFCAFCAVLLAAGVRVRRPDARGRRRCDRVGRRRRSTLVDAFRMKWDSCTNLGYRSSEARELC